MLSCFLIEILRVLKGYKYLLFLFFSLIIFLPFRFVLRLGRSRLLGWEPLLYGTKRDHLVVESKKSSTKL